jgi:hypothetical protein
VPRRNRVTPYGELIAVADRGMFWGNRGVLVDGEGSLARYSRGKAWMICVLSYQGRRRAQWSPGRLTELFFLDEATALAAGHRPCGECRYRDYQEFKRCFSSAAPLGVGEIDARLHADRLASPSARRDRLAGASVRRVYTASLASLPDGSMVDLDGTPHLVLGGRLLRWTPGGYAGVTVTPDRVTVITPRATVAALAAGYRPVLHESAMLVRAALPVKCEDAGYEASALRRSASWRDGNTPK